MIILQRVGTLVTEFADYMAKLQTVAELSQLSDHQLNDIGVSRDQLNVGVKSLWVNNDAPVAKTAQAKSTNTRAKAGFDFGRYVATMYSAQNRPGYMV